MSITVSNITKKYGAQTAVNGISFQINDQEIVGFLGPNGAGKSTTMKMITGYLQADSGSIDVCKIPVTKGKTATNRKIGYLPEANPLYPDMYVKEYIAFVASLYKIDNIAARTKEVIELVGLTAESHKKIAALSKGYKQRVGLAAALVHDPEVLILDEPTSGLDPNQIIEIREVIRKLGQKKTVLFSSHIMQEVEAICDRVIIINQGKIVADDRLERLKSDSAGGHQIHVQFKESVDLKVLCDFIPEQEIHSEDSHHFIIETQHAERVKKQILQFSLNNHLNIISMQSEERNLEGIFRELTSQNKQSNNQ